jgi:parallel beta-helix repeat protein
MPGKQDRLRATAALMVFILAFSAAFAAAETNASFANESATPAPTPTPAPQVPAMTPLPTLTQQAQQQSEAAPNQTTNQTNYTYVYVNIDDLNAAVTASPEMTPQPTMTPAPCPSPQETLEPQTNQTPTPAPTPAPTLNASPQDIYLPLENATNGTWLEANLTEFNFTELNQTLPNASMAFNDSNATRVEDLVVPIDNFTASADGNFTLAVNETNASESQSNYSLELNQTIQVNETENIIVGEQKGPSIFGVNAFGAVDADSATALVSWSTDVASDSWVYFGLSSQEMIAEGASEQVTSHAVLLRDLLPNSTYAYFVKSCTQENCSTTPYYIFVTPASNKTVEELEKARKARLNKFLARIKARDKNGEVMGGVFRFKPKTDLLELYKKLVSESEKNARLLGVADNESNAAKAGNESTELKAELAALAESGEGLMLEGGEYDAEFVPSRGPVKKVAFKNLLLDSNETVFGVDEIPAQQLGRAPAGSWKQAYWFDGSGLQFESATIEAVAAGTALFKCFEWNPLTQKCEGEWVKVLDLVPGENYSVTVTASDPVFAESGVTTINSLKPIYKPGESVELLAVVLNEKGYGVNNASVEITVTDPANNSRSFHTNYSENASGAGVFNEGGVGEYKTWFNETNLTGAYAVFVRAKYYSLDVNMSSSFQVLSDFPFDVERVAPMVLNPWSGEPFTSTIKVTPLNGVIEYNLTEFVPLSYNVTDAGGAVEGVADGAKTLTWSGLKGAATVSYALLPEKKSPDLQMLGPARIDYVEGGAQKSFFEARPWQLAVDDINVSSCGRVDCGTGGNVILTQDIGTSNSGYCILLDGTGCTLNCNNHAIWGPGPGTGGTGIILRGYNHAVSLCRGIFNFSYGVEMPSGTYPGNGTLSFSTIYNNTVGVDISCDGGGTVAYCDIENNTEQGILVGGYSWYEQGTACQSYYASGEVNINHNKIVGQDSQWYWSPGTDYPGCAPGFARSTGILVRYFDGVLKIQNNKGSTYGLRNNSFGLAFIAAYPSSSLIENNTVQYSNTGALFYSSRINLTDNLFEYNKEYGYYFAGTVSGLSQRNVLNHSNYSIYATDGMGSSIPFGYFVDDVYDNSGNYSIYYDSDNLRHNTTYFVNTTFNKNQVVVTGAKNISVGWYVDVKTQTLGGAPISSATVNITSNSSVSPLFSYELLTGSNGFIERQILWEYTQNASQNYANATNYNPYNFTASKTGYPTKSKNYTINYSRTTDLGNPIVFALSDCENITDSNTVYTLTADVSDTGATCFFINASNVTFDCAGHLITGNKSSDSAGINVVQPNNTVKNCIIRNFTYGIEAERRCSAYYNNICVAWASYDGRNSSFYNNSLYENDFGLYFEYSKDNLAFNNTIQGNTRFGYLDSQGDNNSFYNNTVYFNGENGIVLSSLNASGAEVGATTNAIVYNNTVYGHSSGANALVYGCTDANNNLTSNNFSSAFANIAFAASSGNRVINSTMTNDYGSGYIDVYANDSAHDNYIINSSFNATAYYIEDSPSNFSVGWYLDVFTEDSSLQAVAGAQVNVSSSSGALLAQATAGADGFARGIEVLEYKRYGTGGAIINYSPQLIVAGSQATGYGVKSSVVSGASKSESLMAPCGYGLGADLTLPNDALMLEGDCIPNLYNYSLDCAGHYINGSTSGRAVAVKPFLYFDHDNGVVKNCVFNGFATGVESSSVLNLSVYNNSFNCPPPTDYGAVGVLLNQSTNASSIYNNSFTNCTYGVIAFNSSNDNVFHDNNLSVSFTSNAIGFTSIGCTNNSFYDNQIRNYFVAFYDSSKDLTGNFIAASTNNSFYSNNASAYVGVVSKESDYGNYSSNNVSVLYGGAAFYLESSTNALLQANNVTGNGEDYGAFLKTSTSTQVKDNVFNADKLAVKIYGCHDTILEGNLVSALAALSIESGSYNLNSSNNNYSGAGSGVNATGGSYALLFANDSFNATAQLSVYLDESSNMTFLNTTFNKSAAFFGSGSNNFLVRWFVRANVTNYSGGAVGGAAVNITNFSSSAPEYELSTDANGLTPWVAVSEYNQNGSTVFGDVCVNSAVVKCFTPHTFDARANGYKPLTQQENLNETRTVDLVLEELITSCRTLSRANQYALLSQDLSAAGTDCIIIANENITLDCNGHSITGNDTGATYGVKSIAFNATVANCTVSRFYKGIAASGTQNNSFYNNTCYNNSFAGIIAEQSNFTRAFNNTAYQNVLGIGVLGPSAFFNEFNSSNASYNTQAGFFNIGSQNNSFKDNYAFNPGNNVANLYDSDTGYSYVAPAGYGYYENNIFLGDGQNIGVYAFNAEGDQFHGNTISSNAYNLYLYNASSFNFTDTALGGSSVVLDAYFTSGSHDNYFLNTSYDKSKTFFGASSNASFAWYADVCAFKLDGLPVENAEITAYDAYGGTAFQATTQASGCTARQNVTEYYQDSNGVQNYTPHYFVASSASYGVTWNTTEVTSNRVQGQGGNVTLQFVCGQTITQDTVLNSSGNMTGTCITFGANNLKLDCNGNTITGNLTGAGVLASGVSHGVVRNCTIKNFSTGVYLASSPYFTVFNNSVLNTSSEGVMVESGSDYANVSSNLLEFNALNGASNALAVKAVYSNVSFNIVSSVASGSHGIMLQSANNTANDNIVSGVSGGAAIIAAAAYNTVENNTVYSNAFGIGSFNFGAPTFNYFRNNTAYSNSIGFFAAGTQNDSFYNNTAYSNSWEGAYVGRYHPATGADLGLTAYHYFYGNNFSANTGYGLLLNGSSSNTFDADAATNNAKDNLYFYGAEGNVVANGSLARANYGDGFYDVFSAFNSANTLLNESFNKSSTAYDNENSNLSIKWFARAYVYNESNEPVSTALVNITNYSSATPEYADLQVDASGLTPWKVVTEYVQNGSAIIYDECQSQARLACSTPHNFSASTGLVDYYDNFTVAFVNESKTVGVRLGTSHCQELRSDYYLVRDLYNDTQTCFPITAPGVTLDCRGHTISSNQVPGVYGVNVFNSSVTVKNCRVLNFSIGILYGNFSSGTPAESEADNGVAYNNTLLNNSVGGIGSIYLVSHLNLTQNNVSCEQPNSAVGLFSYILTDGNVYFNNTASGCYADFADIASYNNSYLNNSGTGSSSSTGFFVSSSTPEGQYIAPSHDIILYGNSMQGYLYAAFLNDSTDLNASGNAFSSNQYGLVAWNSTRPLIYGNNFSANTVLGLYSHGTQDALVTLNDFSFHDAASESAGAKVFDSSNVTFYNNSFWSNSRGLELNSSYYENASFNSFHDNHAFALRAANTPGVLVHGNSFQHNNNFSAHLSECNGAVIENNSFYNTTANGVSFFEAGWSIYLEASHNASAANNTVYGGVGGIWASSLENFSLHDNNVSAQGVYGVRFDAVNHSLAFNNSVDSINSTGNGNGFIFSTGSYNVTAQQNNVSNCGLSAFYLQQSTNLTVAKNRLSNNSFGVYFDATNYSAAAENSIFPGEWKSGVGVAGGAYYDEVSSNLVDCSVFGGSFGVNGAPASGAGFVNSTFWNNTVTGFRSTGIFLSHAAGTNVSGNVIANSSSAYWNDHAGIRFSDSNDSTAQENLVYNINYVDSASLYNAYGLVVDGNSSGVSLSSNTVFNVSCSASVVSSCTAAGIYSSLDSGLVERLTVFNNTVYNVSASSSSATNYAFGLALGANNSNASFNNVSSISSNGKALGFGVATGNNNAVHNNTASDCYYGAFVLGSNAPPYYSTNNSVYFNSVNLLSGSGQAGFYSWFASDNNVSYNDFSSNYRGVFLDAFSKFNYLNGNKLSYCAQAGAWLYSADNNSFAGNNFSYSAYGAYVSNAIGNDFNANYFTGNEQAIALASSYNNTFKFNNIASAQKRGLYALNSDYNQVAHNSFNDCAWNVSQLAYVISYTSGVWYPDLNGVPYNDSTYVFYGSNGAIPVVGATDISASGYNGTQDLARAIFVNTSNNKNMTAYFNNSAVTDCASFTAWMQANYSWSVECKNVSLAAFIAQGYGNSYAWDYKFPPTDELGLSTDSSYGAIVLLSGDDNNTIYNNTVSGGGAYGVVIGSYSYGTYSSPGDNNVSSNYFSNTSLASLYAANVNNRLNLESNSFNNNQPTAQNCIFLNGVSYANVTNNSAANCSGASSGTGVNLWGCLGALVANNSLADLNTGISAGGETSSSFFFSNNVTRSSNGFTLSHDLHDSEIKYNTFCGNGEGINFYVSPWAYLNPSSPLYSYNDVIKHNLVCNNSGNGISAAANEYANTRDYSHDITIDENTVNGNGANGIYVSYYYKNFAMTNNLVFNNSKAGVYLYHTNETHKIRSNQAYNNSYGILLRNTSNLNDFGYVTGNEAYYNQYGIVVIESSDARASNNYVHNNSVAGEYVFASNNTMLLDGGITSNNQGVVVHYSNYSYLLGGYPEMGGAFYFASLSPFSYNGVDYDNRGGFISKAGMVAISKDYTLLAVSGTPVVLGNENISLALINTTNASKGILNENWTILANESLMTENGVTNCTGVETILCPLLEVTCTCGYFGVPFIARGNSVDYEYSPDPGLSVVSGYTSPPFVKAGITMHNNGNDAVHYLASLAPLNTSGINFSDFVAFFRDLNTGGTQVYADYTDVSSEVNGVDNVDVVLLTLRDADNANATIYYNESIFGGVTTCAVWESLGNYTCYNVSRAWTANGAGKDYSWSLGAGDPTIVPGYTDPPFLFALNSSAVQVINSLQTYFYYANISNSNGMALALLNSNQTFFIESQVRESKNYSIWFRGSTNNSFWNSTINSSNYAGLNDLFLSRNSFDNVFLNTSFDRNKTEWSGTGNNITVQWYLAVRALNKSGQAQAGVEVKIFNLTDPQNYMYDLLTGANGVTDYVVVSEYAQNGTAEYNGTCYEQENMSCFTPHTITGNKTGYFGVTSASANVNQSMIFNLTMRGIWGFFYGKDEARIALRENESNETLVSMNSTRGNVYAADVDSQVNWTALRALGYNRDGTLNTSAFAEADAALGMTGADESIEKVFDANGDGVADETRTFVVFGRTINNVPVVNSTNNSNFVTGILWDSSNDAFFSSQTKPPLVFITALNHSQQGYYGVYDYELRVPSPLAAYAGSTDKVRVYWEKT